MNLESMIEKITQDIVSKVFEIEYSTNNEKKEFQDMGKVLFLVPYQAINLDVSIQKAFDLYSGCKVSVLINGFESFTQKYDEKARFLKLNDENARESILENFDSLTGICLISPGIKMLNDIINFNDTEFVQNLVVNGLIYEKKITIITHIKLDGQPVKNLNEKIKSVFREIESLGIKIEHSGSKKEVCSKSTCILTGLITEKDVIELAKNGTRKLVCQKSCIITPLASDKARDLNITIQFEED